MSESTPPLVAVSISESPPEDLLARGVSKLHLDDLFLELSRHLLASGMNLAYGGDLRATGYTEQLRNLVRTYPRRGADGGRRLRVYLVRSVLEGLDSKESLVETRAVAEIVEVDAAMRFGELPADPSASFALELTAMREMMTEQIAVRIVVGGKMHGAAGRGPGVLEEAHLAFVNEVPLVVIGGFGGAAGCVAHAFTGELDEAESALDESYAPILSQLAASTRPVTPSEMLSDLAEGGLAGLRNGLSDAENRVLFETVDVDEITALVLTVIGRLDLRQ
jgi:hypothetical protein